MRKIFCIVLLLFISIFFTGCNEKVQQVEQKENAYQKIKLVMAVNGTEIATDTKVARKFAELVSKESGGNVTIEIFPNDQLAGGNASQGIQMISDGSLDLAAYAAGVMALMDEHLLIATIPYTFNNYKEARHIIDTTGGKYYKKILELQGMTYLASAHNGFRQITNNKREILTPEDLAGLKIRVPGGEVFLKFWETMGATPVAMSWSETVIVIKQGTIDGQENGFSVTNSAKINEIQKYMTLLNYTYENYLFVANTKIFNSLEPKTRQLISEKAKEACDWGRDLVENDEDNLRKKFVKGGMKVKLLSPEELKPFKDKVQNLRKELMQKYGEEACKAFQIEL